MKSMTHGFWTSINRNTSINAKLVNETDLKMDIIQLMVENGRKIRAE